MQQGYVLKNNHSLAVLPSVYSLLELENPLFSVIDYTRNIEIRIAFIFYNTTFNCFVSYKDIRGVMVVIVW